MLGRDELKRCLRDRRFKRLRYPLLKFHVWMHEKIVLLAVWRRAKILVPADFIVSDRKQSQKIKPAASQNAAPLPLTVGISAETAGALVSHVIGVIDYPELLQVPAG